jgi:hypothetical protein
MIGKDAGNTALSGIVLENLSRHTLSLVSALALWFLASNGISLFKNVYYKLHRICQYIGLLVHTVRTDE